MRGGLFAGALAALLAALPRPTAAQDCPSSKANVTLTVQLVEPSLDNSVSQPRLQAMAGEHDHAGRTMGLYRMQLQSKMEARIGTRTRAGLVCQWIDAVTVALSMSPREIFVVRERPPGTCGYDVVLDHERKHQAVDDAVFAEYKTQLRQKIERAILDLQPERPVPVGVTLAARARLSTFVRGVVTAAVDGLMTARQTRQAQVDNPSEYARLGTACR